MRVVAKLITGGNTPPSWFIDLLSDWSCEVAWARHGSLGAFIEDKNSGTILLQQVLRRGMPAQAIDSKLTAVGKDERAISVSGHVFRGEAKYTEHAFHKTITYKRRSKNNLMDQVESFRVGDKDSKREDDLLDSFCYGIALALGDSKGF